MNRVTKLDIQTSKNRLEQVIRVLKDLPKDSKFNLGSFGIRTESCGTVACACGYASLDSWFREQGFKGVWEEYVRENEHTLSIYYDLENNDISYDSFACMNFFYITEEEFAYLFLPECYQRGNRQNVIRRLKWFVKELDKELTESENN